MATPTFILPSAPTYTEGFVNGLNVYPNPTNFVANQVPFTRATTATRTNAAGLIELVPYNLVQYSEQFDNAAWSKAQASVTANSTTSPDGTTTADSFIETASLTGNKAIFTSPLSITAASTFNLSIYVKSLSGDRNVYLRAFDSSFTIGFGLLVNPLNGAIVTTQAVAGATLINTNVEILNNGWYRISASGILSTSTTLRFSSYLIDGTNASYTGNGTSGVYLWGAQLVEGTAALPYQLTETRLNRPRVDFSLGGCPNLLLEPQRTNLLSYSEQFDDASWSKVNLTVAANSSVSPSGILNADTLTPSATNTQHGTTKSTTFAASTSYTLSVYFKPNGYTSIALRMALDAIWAGGVAPTVTFETTTMTATVTTGIPTYKFEDVGNGWYWCSITATTSVGGSSGVTFYVKEYFPYLANGTSGVFLWGAQLELGAYPTSYIPTSSASVTRNQDSFQLSNVFTNNMISSAGGTWVMDLRNTISRIRDNSGFALFISTSTSGVGGDGFILYNGTAISTRPQIIKFVSGSASFVYTINTDNPKIAIKWNGTTADVFVDGVKVVSATGYTSTSMQFLGNGNQPYPLNINSMALYNTPLSDDECIAKTL